MHIVTAVDINDPILHCCRRLSEVNLRTTSTGTPASASQVPRLRPLIRCAKVDGTVVQIKARSNDGMYEYMMGIITYDKTTDGDGRQLQDNVAPV